MLNRQITKNETNEKDQIIPFQLNNKDLLIVSLLEYICSIHNKSHKVFYLICDYLKENKILEDDSSYDFDTGDVRMLCMNLIKSMMNDKNKNNVKLLKSTDDLITDFKFKDFFDSRYKNDFIEIEKLDKGGFGTVFKSFNKLDSSLYAIKKIKIKKLNEQGHKYYLNEARSLAKLNHPNIVRYYNTWIEINKDTNVYPILYIQMELCKLTLREYLETRNYSGFPFEEKDELNVFKQIVKGLKHIHEKDIIHGDLNPLNIFFGNEMVIKIGDFGLSKKTDEYDNTVNTDSYGNILYMAPENEFDYICNKKTDIYSLGIIYFELIKGFNTQMERVDKINKLKKSVFNQLEINNNHLNFIKGMIKYDYNERFDIDSVKSVFKTLY
jgi:serine/threonine protein kinase